MWTLFALRQNQIRAFGARTGATIAALIVSASAAGAVSQKVKNACANDYLKFCPAYEASTPQARQCMRQAGRRLSPRCIDALADAGEIPRSAKRR